MATDTINEQALAEGSTFVWHELIVSDVQKGLDFYTQALDFEAQAFPMGDMGTYNMLARDGKAVCGVTSMGSEHAPPHWAVYLHVDDVDARVEKCKSFGANLVVPPMDVPTVGRMALIQDPLGAHIWLFKGAPQ